MFTTKSKINILMVGLGGVFGAGIRQILSSQEDIQILAECELDKTALKVIDDLPFNVVLIDINPSSLSGISLAREIARLSPTARLILLSSYPSDDQLFEAIKAGASAYLSKDVSPNELTDTIRRVYQGNYPINDSLLKKPIVADRVLRQFQDLSVLSEEMEGLAIPLTAREREILSHISTGHSNKQVAVMLGLSEQTVKNHVTSILRKLNANDRTHAVVLALRRGWIESEEKENIFVTAPEAFFMYQELKGD